MLTAQATVSAPKTYINSIQHPIRFTEDFAACYLADKKHNVQRLRKYIQLYLTYLKHAYM